MVSKHAQENANKYLNKNYTNKAAAMRFQGACNAAMSKSGSTAVVLTLDNPVSNPHRDDWAPNDRLVGIVRNHNLVTVMLSRKNQINSGHLRTDRIVIA
jgi:hypothetical protein